MNTLIAHLIPRRPRIRKGLAALTLMAAASTTSLKADTEVYLTDVPDYRWYAGCYGTATGNLFGYWDRHGFSNFYTGPTAGGIAPLNDVGANIGIRSMWASKAGFDGRPADRPGHIDDYWDYYVSDGSFSYESTKEDPYVLMGRPEHEPDCVADFIGLSQKKWTNQNGECDGNIDAYSFNYWDASGNRRLNYQPGPEAGLPARDIQSGLREWSQYRGYDADVYSQLTDFNPATPPGKGFTFEDLKREINAGYPVLVFLQFYDEMYRSLSNPVSMPKANPDIHGMLVYGYAEDSTGTQVARIRTSWGSGDYVFDPWNSSRWRGILPVRGVIVYHPKPKVTEFKKSGDFFTLSWQGPTSRLYDVNTGSTQSVSLFQVEYSATLDPPNFTPVTSPSTTMSAKVPAPPGLAGFYRINVVAP
jgi:hypothetical protein